jgi:hypothetical protein
VTSLQRDSNAQVVCLVGQVRGGVVIRFLCLELGVPEVAPEDGEHPEFVANRKCLLRFGDILVFRAAEAPVPRRHWPFHRRRFEFESP